MRTNLMSAVIAVASLALASVAGWAQDSHKKSSGTAKVRVSVSGRENYRIEMPGGTAIERSNGRISANNVRFEFSLGGGADLSDVFKDLEKGFPLSVPAGKGVIRVSKGLEGVSDLPKDMFPLEIPYDLKEGETATIFVNLHEPLVKHYQGRGDLDRALWALDMAFEGYKGDAAKEKKAIEKARELFREWAKGIDKTIDAPRDWDEFKKTGNEVNDLKTAGRNEEAVRAALRLYAGRNKTYVVDRQYATITPETAGNISFVIGATLATEGRRITAALWLEHVLKTYSLPALEAGKQRDAWKTLEGDDELGKLYSEIFETWESKTR